MLNSYYVWIKQQLNLKFQTHGGVLSTRIVLPHEYESVASFDSLKWAQWSVKNVNFCSHGSPLCPISLRDWHAYISKYGPSQTWFQFKSDVTLWAQGEMSLFYVSASSPDSHFKHFQSNRRTFRILYSFFSILSIKKNHCKEQVVKSNMTVHYLIRFVFIASNALCPTICCLCKTFVLISL